MRRPSGHQPRLASSVIHQELEPVGQFLQFIGHARQFVRGFLGICRAMRSTPGGFGNADILANLARPLRRICSCPSRSTDSRLSPVCVNVSSLLNPRNPQVPLIG